MIRKVAVVGAAAALLAGVGIEVASFASASSTLSAPRTLRFVEIDNPPALVDVSPRGVVNPGDQAVFIGLLFRQGIKKPVGHVELVSTIITPGMRPDLPEAVNVVGTAYLPEGKIVAAGAFHLRKRFRVPVVGGTGAYANARGEIEVIELSPTKSLDIFRLVP